MGCISSKCREEEEKAMLCERILRLEEEVKDARYKREQESRAYGHCVALLSSKEIEWKKESKRCAEEVATLKRRVEEEEGWRKAVEASSTGGGNEWQQQLNACYLVEQMRAEQIRREEAAEKWKRLYHAIKIELDELILRTRQGEMLFWGNEEVMEGLRRELKAREETVESLRSRMALMEAEGIKREREIDILRQSLRILSNTKRNAAFK